MPLLLSKRIDLKSAYAIWKISETNYQLEQLHDETAPQGFHRNKTGEWIATRMLIKNLCGRFKINYQGITKDEHGKPFLIGSTAQISISHSFPIASAMIHLDKPCGIDVEWPRAKMSSIQSKFLHEDEMAYKDDQTSLCIIWAAKEAIYKAYGKKKLSFREHISVKLDKSEIQGRLLLNGQATEVPLTMEKIKQYFLVYSR